jgi:high-affinity Fe2+/Pb2+ permease
MAPAPIKDTDPTIGRLIADATQDISTLVSKEIQLVKSELKITARTSGIGVALLCAAAFLLLIFIILLSMTAAFLIHWGGAGLALHWSFGIVTLFYLVIAGILALVGVKKIKKVKGPERAIRQAQASKALLKR